MNIYEEAIKEVKMFFNDEDWVHKSIMPKTIKALERAKKEHALLELRKKERTIIESFISGNYPISKQHRDIIEEIKFIEEELK